MKTLLKFTSYFLCAFLFSCANPSSPTGGLKDEKKPRLTKTFPKPGSTYFRGKLVVFTFNEWVAENNLKDQIIITPKIDNFKHSVNKNILTLTFDTGSFRPNTTYYLNLREGIKDITEGNKSDSTTLVFSTGSSLDSLFFSGEAIFTLENKKEKDVSIALFQPNDTFHIETATPLYLTKTDQNGKFTFSYLKKGTYLLYAFKDENKNGKYNPNKEPIAYLPQEIQIDQQIPDVYLPLVKEDHQIPKIKTIETNKKKLTKITYQKPLNKLIIKNLNTYNMNICTMLKQDEVSIFTNVPSKDSIQLILEASDMSENTSIDTIKTVALFVDTSKCTLTSTPQKNSEIEPTATIQIFLSKPFTKFNNKIELTTHGKTYKGNEIKEIAEIKEIPYLACIQITPKKEWLDTVKIMILPTTFQPISGYLKDTLKTKFPLKSLEKYGSIGGEVECQFDSILIQLLSKDDKILKQVQYSKKFLFLYLTDAEYKIRVIEDANHNKVWDQGDFRTRTLPEKVHYYSEPIKLKSNWEILDVKIRF